MTLYVREGWILWPMAHPQLSFPVFGIKHSGGHPRTGCHFNLLTWHAQPSQFGGVVFLFSIKELQLYTGKKYLRKTEL